MAQAQKPPARKVTAYLIYRASDKSLRVIRSRPQLAWDEVAFVVELSIPEPWGRLAGSILVELPENGPAVIEVVPPPVTP